MKVFFLIFFFFFENIIFSENESDNTYKISCVIGDRRGSHFNTFVESFYQQLQRNRNIFTSTNEKEKFLLSLKKKKSESLLLNQKASEKKEVALTSFQKLFCSKEDKKKIESLVEETTNTFHYTRDGFVKEVSSEIERQVDHIDDKLQKYQDIFLFKGLFISSTTALYLILMYKLIAENFREKDSFTKAILSFSAFLGLGLVMIFSASLFNFLRFSHHEVPVAFQYFFYYFFYRFNLLYYDDSGENAFFVKKDFLEIVWRFLYNHRFWSILVFFVFCKIDYFQSRLFHLDYFDSERLWKSFTPLLLFSLVTEALLTKRAQENPIFKISLALAPFISLAYYFRSSEFCCHAKKLLKEDKFVEASRSLWTELQKIASYAIPSFYGLSYLASSLWSRYVMQLLHTMYDNNEEIKNYFDLQGNLVSFFKFRELFEENNFSKKKKINDFDKEMVFKIVFSGLEDRQAAKCVLLFSCNSPYDIEFILQIKEIIFFFDRLLREINDSLSCQSFYRVDKKNYEAEKKVLDKSRDYIKEYVELIHTVYKLYQKTLSRKTPFKELDFFIFWGIKDIFDSFKSSLVLFNESEKESDNYLKIFLQNNGIQNLFFEVKNKINYYEKLIEVEEKESLNEKEEKIIEYFSCLKRAYNYKNDDKEEEKEIIQDNLSRIIKFFEDILSIDDIVSFQKEFIRFFEVEYEGPLYTKEDLNLEFYSIPDENEDYQKDLKGCSNPICESWLVGGNCICYKRFKKS
jgi:hypothetical protein